MGKINKYKKVETVIRNQSTIPSQETEQQTPTPNESSQKNTNGQTQQTAGDAARKAVAGSSPPKPLSSPKRGTFGVPGVIEVNYLKLDLNNMPNIAYQYFVSVYPSHPKRLIRMAFEKFNARYFPDIGMAFDGGKSVYMTKPLPCNETTETVQVNDIVGNKFNFKITIRETENLKIDLNSLRTYFRDRIYDKPMRAIQCLDVVLQSACHSESVRAGRSFYVKPKSRVDLGDGYELWMGLFQSAVLGDQPFVNVDVSYKSVPSSITLMDYVTKFCKKNSTGLLQEQSYNKLNAFIKGLSLIYKSPPTFKSPPRILQASSITEGNSKSLTFVDAKGEELTIEKYFSKKGSKITYPKLNCVDLSTTKRKIIVPLECCQVIEGQPLCRKDQPEQAQQLIKRSIMSTNKRKSQILEMVNMFDFSSNFVIRQFGIKMDIAFTDVSMRLLKPPSLQYLNREFLTIRNGFWRYSETTKFLDTKPKREGHKWAIMYKASNRLGLKEVVNFARELLAGSRKVSLILAPKPIYQEFKDTNIANTFKDLKAQRVDIVFVVIPTRGHTYNEIKQIAELRFGVLTQCIREMTLTQPCNNFGTVISHLLLKINIKLNGINYKISEESSVPLKNVMFLGADVTHPTPENPTAPSVVGSAATHDEFGISYNIQYRLQKSKEEHIGSFESIVLSHLAVYKKHMNRYPESIIYYRDGVSDGQFPIIKKVELSSIKTALKKLNIKAKVTCIVVIKRHHTRFFPKTISNTDKYNNVESGTVVDRLIIHPNEREYYLVSHQCIQGSAKPTRYIVIEDEANLDIDFIQKLTFNMCHMFPRCNRAVSYPAPAYLAHLAAYRARLYVDGNENVADSDNFLKMLMTQNPMFFI